MAEYDALRQRAATLAGALEDERAARAADAARCEQSLAVAWSQLENTLARLGERTTEIEHLEHELAAAQTEIQKLRFERRSYAEKLDRELRAKHEELVVALQDLSTADREIDRLRRMLDAAQARAGRLPLRSVPRGAG